MDDATPPRPVGPGKEAENANKAVSDPDVMAYIGTFNSGAAKISIPILERGQHGHGQPGQHLPGPDQAGQGRAERARVYYPNGKRNYARVVPADDLQGAVGAAWAKQIGGQKAYVFDDQQLYGKGIANVFADTAKGRAWVVGREGIDVQA